MVVAAVWRIFVELIGKVCVLQTIDEALASTTDLPIGSEGVRDKSTEPLKM